MCHPKTPIKIFLYIITYVGKISKYKMKRVSH